MPEDARPPNAISETPIPKPAGFSAADARAHVGLPLVYPAHGVGRLVAVEVQDIAGHKIEMAVIEFERDKMTLRVPTAKFASVGVRKLADRATVEQAMATLGAKPRRLQPAMWNRRARDYELKIISGDLVAIAEVARDLYASQTHGAQTLFETALNRATQELSAIDGGDVTSTSRRIIQALAAGRAKAG